MRLKWGEVVHQWQQFRQLTSLRWRLTILLGFILLCTLLVIGFSVAAFVRRAEADSWRGRQGEATRNAVQSVSNLVERADLALQLISAFGLDEFKVDTGALQMILENNQTMQELVYLNSRGEMVAAAVAGAPILRNETNVAQREWFVAAQRDKSYFSDLHLDAHNPYLIIATAAPNQSVIAARLSISALWQVVGDIRFGENGSAYVVNHRGEVIAHTNQSQSKQLPNIAGRPELVGALTTPDLWYGEYVNFDGEHVVGVAAAVPGVNWVVITELPDSEAFAYSRRAYYWLGSGMLAFVILVMWASAEWLEAWILTPIDRLRDGAEHIGRGGLTHRIEVIHQDEIGQVAVAFNQMAKELQDLYASLEQKIADRTLQLEQQTTELARSNAELAQFAYIASHDLQEPLRMVSSYLQLLERRYKGQLDADADEFIDFAVDGATRMQQLIRDLLAYSRVGTRSQPFTIVDLNQICAQVLDDLQVAIQERGATIQVEPLPLLMADATQLGQLLQNLLGNALKFCQTHPPLITLCATLDAATQEWRFAVKDNGIGIEALYFERIFLIFQRLHTRAEYPGTGIGLAICKKIVERHNGRIWVESQPDQGTTFFFTLPAVG